MTDQTFLTQEMLAKRWLISTATLEHGNPGARQVAWARLPVSQDRRFDPLPA